MILLDGYLKIKTKIDNKDVDKGITELENKIKKLQEDNSKSSKEQNLLQKELDNYQELQASADRYKQKIKELNEEKNLMFKNSPALAVSVDTPEYANIKSQISDMQLKYSQATAEIDKQGPKIEKVCAKLDKVKLKQTENNAKIQQFKDKIEAIKTNNIKNSIDGIGKSITGQISKIGKMTMAIVGIRTAWSAVRRAVSLVSQYNPQIATDLQYMSYCIANLVAPAVQWLTRLLYTALSYINAIMQAWFGVNIFANSSAKAFKKMQNSASGTAKATKEIQKSLQGFDEMNIMQDNSGNTGGGTGVSTPSMDLSNMQGEVPTWLQWIIDNKDLILAVLAGITAGLISIKIFGLDPIMASGIVLLISGIVYAVQNLIKYLKDPTWESFGGIIQGVGVAIMGLAVLIGSVPLAVAGAIVLIVGTITKYWEQIKGFFQSGIDWLVSKSDWIHEIFGDTIGNIYDMFVNNLQNLLNSFDSIFKMVRGIFDGFIMFIKGVFTGNWKMAWEGIKKIFTSIWEGIKGVFFSVWNNIKNVVATVGKTVGNIIVNTFKAVVNGVLSAIENILNSPINSINGLIGVINEVPGINLGYLRTFNLPRLAKGGVISQPTQAIIGEAGKEAVVPLENNMEWLDMLADKLASKIGTSGGSYIINLDGRVIQRGQAKRKQELAFATNGR
uniref:Minor tail protein n=2 Tax=unclassified Caudoviricetes TaxID=2788787 RepID=A0A8S5QFN2_9CAUD|nr:MAG TPA: minor tail protein [Siphoviridae sp. ctMkg9]DAE17888.1 MAG TPA: minor tail protein [Siphoviridae sp. ctRBF36]